MELAADVVRKAGNPPKLPIEVDRKSPQMALKAERQSPPKPLSKSPHSNFSNFSLC